MTKHLSDLPTGTAFRMQSDARVMMVVLSHSENGYTKVMAAGQERPYSIDCDTEVQECKLHFRSSCFHPFGFKVCSYDMMGSVIDLVVGSDGEAFHTLKHGGSYISAKALNGALVLWLCARTQPDDTHVAAYVAKLLEVQ